MSVASEKFKMINGQEQSLAAFKGKPVLFVNIATQCGYTPQLDGLESIYQKYNAKGLTVVGVPSNEFGGQTPEAEADVQKLCKLRYGVTFPLTEKMLVKGSEKHALFRYLTAAGDGAEIKWNFEKFLVDKNGKVVERFPSSVTPQDAKLLQAIEGQL